MTQETMEKIAPFFWVEHDSYASVGLYVGDYLQDLFLSRAGEGFEGSGYDWESLARAFLDEVLPDLTEKIDFESDRSMFRAYSKDRGALEEFIRIFKSTCGDRTKISDLFSRAELD